MHIRVRMFGKPDTIVVVESKLTKINRFREILKEKFDVEPKLQRLFYGGKLLENGYTFHDYNIRLNDVIQLMVYIEPKQSETENSRLKTKDDTIEDNSEKGIDFKDGQSNIYAVGDLIDMKDKEYGAWFEGKIKRIVIDPQSTDTSNTESVNTENVSPNKTTTDSHLGILYQINLEAEEEDSYYYCQECEIRPRARTAVDVSDLVVGTTYMLNHNSDQPGEKGYWYDFKLDLVKKVNRNTELIGTLYLGPDSVPQNETKVRVHDKIFAIEQAVPLADRSEEYKKSVAENPGKRSQPLNCLKCRDNEDILCKDCGCYICSGKEFPDKIVLCDECEFGFHMICLDPPLTQLPEGDWYCPGCKRDTKEVVAPGAAKQTKKVSTNPTTRDWGRGMACVGKTKTSLMPANHFGPIPGIEVGMCWRFRIQLSESGVHRPPVSGIHGRDVEGAYSIVLSGGYEDDVDNGIEFTYTGSGGRDLSGNKRTAEQSCDQKLSRENKALARNCAVSSINETGGDAGENWRNGKPVRVVRSYKMMKHFPKYAPKEGIRYDGIYKVVKYYPEKGLSGFIVWKYLLRRDDPTPAPWEPNAKQYTIVYPDGFLEAEAEKKALKEKNKGKNKGKASKKSKRSMKALDTSSSDASTPTKTNSITQSPESPEIIKVKIPAIFTRLRRNKNQNENNNPSSIEKEDTDVVTSTTKSSEDEADFTVVKDKKKGKSKITRVSKRTLKESNTSSSDFNPSPAPKRKKPHDSDNSLIKSPDSVQVRIPKIILKDLKNKKVDNVDNCLSTEEMEVIKADTLNSKLWSECLIVSRTRGKKEFVEYVTQMFLCIICQEVTVNPVTTSCLHNFCTGCLKLAFESSETPSCPCCRKNVSSDTNEPNDKLKIALQTIMPGYDGGK